MTKVRHLASRLPARKSTSEDRPISVRLDDERLNHLQGLADIDETNVAEQIRQATIFHVQNRRAASDLEDQIAAAVARFRNSISPLIGSQLEPAPVFAPPARTQETEKPLTLRLPQETVEYLNSLALLDDFTIADEVRAAIDSYVAARRSDPDLDLLITQTRQKYEQRMVRLRGHRAAS